VGSPRKAERARWLAPVTLAALAACAHHVRDDCALDSPGAPWLAFSSRRTGSYNLFLARADGSCVAQVTSGTSQDLYPSFGPRWRIAFASDRNLRAGIWIHDLATATDWAVDVGSLAATSPAFSPDGRTIAFEGRPPGASTTDIFLVDAAGGATTQLTSDPANDAVPVWSPDAGTVYFVSTRGGGYDVWSVPATGGAAVRVTTGSAIVGKPAVAPDGSALYYTRTTGGNTTEIVRHELATGVVTVVTSESDSEPAVSPAGDRLAVRSFRDGQADLFVVSALDGSGAVQITDDPASDGAPSFAPAP
jgi:TolB protein